MTHTFCLFLVLLLTPLTSRAQTPEPQPDSVALRVEAKQTITKALDAAYSHDYLAAINGLEELASWPRMHGYLGEIKEAIAFVNLRYQRYNYEQQCREGVALAAQHKHRHAIRAFKAAQRYAHTEDEHAAAAQALRQVRRCRNRCTAIRGALVAALLPIDLMLYNGKAACDTPYSTSNTADFPLLTALFSTTPK